MGSPFPSRDEIAAKKEKREREAKVNMARYLEQRQNTLNNTARLRALRLAQAQQETKPARTHGDQEY